MNIQHSDETLVQYQSHKTVHAVPMTRGQYYRQTAGFVPENVDISEAGYLVVYRKGGTNENSSWVAKNSFEEGYDQVA